jgi:tetratricopeptide (TPR) repeat protein
VFILFESQRLDEAEESYVKALQLDPNYKDAEEELFKIRLEQLSVCLHAQLNF